MATLDELIAMAKAGVDKLPDNYADELETAALMAMESRDETIKSLESANATLDGKVKSYAVQNLDLMRNRPNTTEEKEKEPELTPMEQRRNHAVAFDNALKEYK